MRSFDPQVQAIKDRLASQVKPPPMRMVHKGGFGVWEETLIQFEDLPPPPKPWTFRDVINPLWWIRTYRTG